MENTVQQIFNTSKASKELKVAACIKVTNISFVKFEITQIY